VKKVAPAVVMKFYEAVFGWLVLGKKKKKYFDHARTIPFTNI
jgi:predicted enzyme related to lactoylglutathione lyase